MGVPILLWIALEKFLRFSLRARFESRADLDQLKTVREYVRRVYFRHVIHDLLLHSLTLPRERFQPPDFKFALYPPRLAKCEDVPLDEGTDGVKPLRRSVVPFHDHELAEMTIAWHWESLISPSVVVFFVHPNENRKVVEFMVALAP